MSMRPEGGRPVGSALLADTVHAVGSAVELHVQDSSGTQGIDPAAPVN